MRKTALMGLWAACVCVAAQQTPTAAATPDVVLYAVDAATLRGNWALVADSSAAAGTRLNSADLGWSNTTAPIPAPADYVEFTFVAPAATPYHVWLRMRATANSKFNDSLYLQFSDAVSTAGVPLYAIGTTSGLVANLATDAAAKSLNGWGWVDGAYWLTQASTIAFSSTGSHKIRIQTREDGVQFDQVVLSPGTFLSAAPGGPSRDATIVPKPILTSTPYLTTPAAIPGTIEVENFDNGGEGVAYHDDSPGNAGGVYRATDVDIAANADNSGYVVGWVSAGEWLKYSVNVASAGTYSVGVKVASSGAGGTFHLEANGTNLTGSMSVPNTGGWQTWQTVTAKVTLAAGPQVLRLVMDTSGLYAVGNFDSMQFAFVPATSTLSTPFHGTALAVPGTIEIEDFDNGGEAVAYHDDSAGNAGGQYRSTDVDIAANADNTGYVVGWVSAGEWLKYSVNVASAGSYTAAFRVASSGAGGTFHLEANGTNVTGPLSVPDTGGWQNWQNVTQSVSLTAGPQVLRLVMDSAGLYAVGNFDSLQLTAAAAATVSVSTPYLGTPTALPGTILAAQFDNGGEGVAYHDSTAGNTGGAFRSTDVDIEPSSTGGFDVSWITDGEWLAYTVTVATAGQYTVEFRVASTSTTGRVHAAVGGTSSSVLSVPNTGGGQNWAATSTTVALAAGTQILTIVADAGGFNLASVNVSAVAPPTTTVATTVPLTYAAISDRQVRPKPSLPVLGAAGFKFTDPTFGSAMLRVTDANTRPASVGVSYRSPSETPTRAWNSTTTRFYVTSTDGTIVPYAFDAASMTAARIPGAQDGGLILAFASEPEFSLLSPDLAFGFSSQYDHAVVTQYDFRSNGYTVIADTRNIVPNVDANGRTYLRGVETGATAGTEYMTFIFGGTSQDQDHYAIWFPVGNLGMRKLVDTVASTINGLPTNIPLGFHAHAVAIDLSGRFVVIGATAGDIAAGKAPNYVWDTLTDTFSTIPLNANGGGHAAMGFGVNVNNPDDIDAMDFIFRDLQALGATRFLISPMPTPSDFSASSHASWANAQPTQLVPILAAMFRYGNDTNPWREWDEEVIAIRTDGVESRVWRFAHHRSNYNNNTSTDTDPFWYTPRPNISPDGRWAIFTSNWEKTLGDDTRETNKRQDVFLVRLQ